MPRGTSVSAFIASMTLRLAQLERISTGNQNSGVWLGGFFQPEAYVTATRQAVAHAKGWSLEQLVLGLDVEDVTAEGFKVDGESSHLLGLCEKCQADVSGLKVEGATWKTGRLELNDGQYEPLKTCQLVWRKSEPGGEEKKASTVNIPVYLNPDRADVLFSVDLECGGCDQAEVAQRGVCLIA